MNRYLSLDYIRVFGVMGIVLCHCCFGIDGMFFLGKFLGGTFNVVFLTLSAFLLGLSWEKNGNKPYKVNFLLHRISKLLYSYYPFLIVMFAFMAIVGQTFSIKDIIMHVCLLPWFDKLTGFGHLWFITMILICYIGIFLASKASLTRTRICIVLMIVGSILTQIVLGLIGQPNYIFIYLFLYIGVWANAKIILELAKGIQLIPIGMITLLAFVVVIALSFYGMLDKYTSVWSGVLCAILFFLLANRVFQNAEPNRVINFISMISFEIYLVHHVLCFGKYSLFNYIDNPLLGILAIGLLSICLAYPLHCIGLKLQNCINFMLRRN